MRLRNDDGRYAIGSAPAALAPGGEIAFEPGCVTTDGAEYAFGRRCWITAVRRVRSGGTSIVEVDAEGAWNALAEWRAPRQVTWTGGTSTVYSVLREIARHAGVFLEVTSASAEATNVTPAYTVRAGERGDRAFARLLERLPDDARALGTVMTLTEPSDAETPARRTATTATRSPRSVRSKDGAPPDGRACSARRSLRRRWTARRSAAARARRSSWTIRHLDGAGGCARERGAASRRA